MALPVVTTPQAGHWAIANAITETPARCMPSTTTWCGNHDGLDLPSRNVYSFSISYTLMVLYANQY
jgi:hypothetical protein